VRIIILGLLLAGLAYVNLIRYETPIEVEALTKRSAQATQAPGSLDGLTKEGVLDPASLSQVQSLSRPVFNRDRRPYKVAAKPKPAPKPKAQPQVKVDRPNFVLLGVSIAGTQRTALVLDRGNGTPEWLPIGGVLEEFELVSIEPEAISMRKSGKTFTFELYAQN